MFTRPDDLSDDALVAAVAAGWGIVVDAVEYLPVGFGSFHWRLEADGRPWFVSVDDLIAKRRARHESHHEPLQRLRAALSTARCLRDEEPRFVVAPIDRPSGELVHTVADRFAIAVYPYIDGEAAAWGSSWTDEHRIDALDLVVRLHRAAAAPTSRHALVDDFTIPNLDELAAALTDLSRPWDTGPFAESTRKLLGLHAGDIEVALRRYDKLVADARQRPERAVLTHGEPHSGNILTTASGPVLIDWDTALLAPPERDVWTLADGVPQMRDLYTARTGVALLDDTLTLYRLWWDLSEISICVGIFQRPHGSTEDTSVGWAALTRCLDPTRWQPH
jgi:spectinomycin phosphotransferase/16S rRNA (guanine(1405)-N(7))-methyltransferase